MARPDLSSAHGKLAWADRPGLALLEEILQWGDPNSNPIVQAPWEDHEEDGRTIVRAARVKAIPSDWAFAIGDIVSNYRAALNYAAVDLVRAGNTPAQGNDKGVQFPIVNPTKGTTEAQFLSLGDWAHHNGLPGVTLPYLQAIAPFEPFANRRRDRLPLDALRTLSNRDKHQAPILTAAAQIIHSGALSGGLRIVGTGRLVVPFESSLTSSGTYLEADCELARIHWDSGLRPVAAGSVVTSDNEVLVTIQFGVSVAFHDYSDMEVLKTLEGISKAVGAILDVLATI